jgi:phage-related baseplate assembly protein
MSSRTAEECKKGKASESLLERAVEKSMRAEKKRPVNDGHELGSN